jgi:hypothetical protein
VAQLRPRRLNTSVASLFMVGSTCFAVGAFPAYSSGVSARTVAVTFFVGSLFFTSASFGQLVQSQSPLTAAGAANEDARVPVKLVAWLPSDRGWLAAATQFPGTLFFNMSTFLALYQAPTVTQTDRFVWAPDFYGSTLFLISSVFAILALSGGFLAFALRSVPWWIAWLNMCGSVFFMLSALGAYVVPSTGLEVDPFWVNMGTLAGALCFLVGAGLMLPAWRRSAAGERA